MKCKNKIIATVKAPSSLYRASEMIDCLMSLDCCALPTVENKIASKGSRKCFIPVFCFESSLNRFERKSKFYSVDLNK